MVQVTVHEYVHKVEIIPQKKPLKSFLTSITHQHSNFHIFRLLMQPLVNIISVSLSNNSLNITILMRMGNMITTTLSSVTLLMSNVTFTNITYTNSTTPDGKTITIIETHTPNNLFTIIIYLVSERTSFLNSIITPKEIKIDFSIIDYPFVNQTSQLALITQVETPFTITPEQNTYDEEQGTATQESGLNISSANHSGFFTWANDAIVDNTTYPVNVTVLSQTEQTFTGDNQETYTQTQVIFSYPRGESIIHDPKIGVIEPPWRRDLHPFCKPNISPCYLSACLCHLSNRLLRDSVLQKKTITVTNIFIFHYLLHSVKKIR